jgi:hypothetical protein
MENFCQDSEGKSLLFLSMNAED